MSVGLDIGTTSSQMVLSRLMIENRASAFAVPELAIAERQILYRSPVHFTPLLDEHRVDAEALRKLVAEEYRKAGICREDVDTGAVIITGETGRKENARAVLEKLSDFAGDFVVATAGPDLESVLAAKGAGAVEYGQKTGKTLLHMDIGGGTSNLALIRDGKIVKTGCLNVGGRLLKLTGEGIITYVSPVLQDLTRLCVGDRVSREQVAEVARLLVRGLEMAAGLRQREELLERLWTKECGPPWTAEGAVISFSGGVADCIDREGDWLRYGDMGPVLGRAIRESRLCADGYVLGRETIRATVIGAGCYSTQLSGSTVFFRNVTLPIKNLPVVDLTDCSPETIRRELGKLDGEGILALPGMEAPSYRQVADLAEQILRGISGSRVLVCLQQDMAKALGQALAARMDADAQILCIDRVKLPEGSFLDVGEPVGPALPVVVKTLVLSK